ncbi:MAG: tetratricopeptide repeat protein, partial [Myxococcota bacterium]
RALLARDEPDRAIAAYEQALAALRGDNRVLGPVLRELAEAQLAAGRTEDALATVDRGLRISGRSTGVRAELLDVLTRVHRQAETLPALAARLTREARRFDEVELLGRVRDELGEDEAALQAYRRALRLNPRSVDTRVRVVQLLSRSGRLEEVVEEYRALVRAAPREPRFVVELAQLLMQVGRREEALRLAAETSRRHRREVAVHQALAELYTVWGEQELATEELGALVRVEPRDPAHLIALGEQLLDSGDEAGALATWRRILQVERNAGEAHATLARVFADHDRLELSERHWRDALRREPDRAEWLRGLGSVLERPRRGESAAQRRERDLEAVRHWERVLVATEDSASRREARRRVVGVWARRNELPAKLREWRQAFAAEPPNVGAGRFLAEAYLRSRPRDVARAAAVLERVTALDPGDLESLLALERVRTAQGDLAGAIEVLQRLAEADARKAPRYLQRMAEHAHALYRDEDAVRYAAAAVARSPDDAEAHRRLGDLLRARQEFDRAIVSYGRALELNDRLFGTYFDLAELQLARGETDAADALYRKVLRRCPDDDLVARAGRASLQIHLGAGSLEVLEATLLPLAIAQARRPVFRKLAVEVYDVLVAPLARRWSDGGEGSAAARASLDRLGRRALKPLLEALVDDDPAQQRVAVDVLGYLGNANAAEPLVAMAEGDAPA